MKNKRIARVGVERGYGPRHAFNAQEGSEAVPGALPEPPPEEYALKNRRNSFENLRPALLAQELGQELGALTKEDVAKLGISLLMGGEGPEAMSSGAVPIKTWSSWKTVKPGVPDGAGAIKVDNAGNHYQMTGMHATDDPMLGTIHAIVKPVEAPGATKPVEDLSGWGKVKNITEHDPNTGELLPKSDKQFPSLDKPPYDALKAPEDFSHEELLAMQKEQEEGPSPEALAKWEAIKGKYGIGKNEPPEEPPPEKTIPKNPFEQTGKTWEEYLKDNPPKELPPEEEPPFEPNVPRHRRGKSSIHSIGGKPGKIGAAKGFGPRHAENSKEGDDLTQVNTDTVPAMLTPREAVLNRNAAELAGRPQIEALNEQGNELAKKGVDLAARGQASVPNVKVPVPKVSGSGNVMKYLLPGELRREAAVGLPKLKKGDTNVKMKSKHGGPQPQQVPQFGKLPAPPQASGGFYPPGMGLKFAEGTPQVPGGIGTPNPSTAYDPRAQVDFKAPDISGFIKALHDEAKKQGISSSQMGDIVKQFSGMGAGGGYANQSPSAGEDFGNPNYIGLGTPSYQGGISDIGYPPFLMPNAEYHADKGSTWVGAYDPAFLVQRYARGTGSVGNFNPDFTTPEPGYFGKLASGAYPGPKFNNPNDPSNAPDLPPIGRSQTPLLDQMPLLDQFDAQTADYYRTLQGGFSGFGNAPPEGTPGSVQGFTQHPNYFDAQGYPYAQPVNSTDNPVPKFQWRPKQRS